MSKTTVTDLNGVNQTRGVGSVFKNAVDVTNGTIAYKMGLRKMPLNSSENGLTTGDVGAAFTLSAANSGGCLTDGVRFGCAYRDPSANAGRASL